MLDDYIHSNYTHTLEVLSTDKAGVDIVVGEGD